MTLQLHGGIEQVHNWKTRKVHVIRLGSVFLVFGLLHMFVPLPACRRSLSVLD